MSTNKYLVPAVPVRPGEVSFEYRDTRTNEVSHPFSMWELCQLKQHHLPDYREAVSPTDRRGVREQLTLFDPDGHALDLGRPLNETTYPTDNKGRLGKAIAMEYFDYYTVKLKWDPRKVELLLRNAFLVKTWHVNPDGGWNVEVKFRDVDYSVLNQRRW